MRFALATALASLRARRGRTALTATGIATAALVLGLTLTVAYALQTGFDRAAARSDLPTIVVRFGDTERGRVDARVRTLPNLASRAYRYEQTDLRLRAVGGRALDKGVVHVVSGSARRGYAIVAGRDVRPRAPGEVVIERGLARAWGLRPGDRLRVGRRLGWMRIVGVAVSPDNVAYPLARTARVYVDERALLRRLGAPAGARFPVNMALLWARNPARADVLVSTARQQSFGLRSLRFLTASGVRALVEQAAGLIIALLVAFGAVAAGLAGVLLAAGAQSEVQRALDQIGLQRAIGATPGTVVAVHAARGGLVAAPAAAIGLAGGALLAASPVQQVLVSLNEFAPGAGTSALLLGGVWAAAVALVAACSAIPAWRASRRPPAELLRGAGDVALRGAGRSGRRGRGGLRPGSLAKLGVRLVAARRARLAAVVSVLGAATAVVMLLLALASLLQRLRDDPATLGKRYQLTTSLPPDRAGDVARIDGIEAAAPRFATQATSGPALGLTFAAIAYPGDHTRFESPPLATGRRVRGPNEAEVGVGLADALGLRPGATLVVQAQAPREARFRVVGIVRALQDEGRVAYVQPDRLQDAGATLDGPIAIRLRRGADRAAVARGLAALGAVATPVRGATGDASGFLGVLASLLRIVAVTVAVVCLHALVQALALTARERRGAVATLRAAGADARALRRLLTGAATAIVAPALLVAVALETLVLAPAVAALAAGYADLPLRATAGQVVLVAAGLCALAYAAVWVMVRRLSREPVAAGLREDA
jgi:ABC-type lipoprotein release transport system permease subunit